MVSLIIKYTVKINYPKKLMEINVAISIHGMGRQEVSFLYPTINRQRLNLLHENMDNYHIN